MPITIIAVGKKHDTHLSESINRYQKRLKRPFTVEWKLIPHSPATSSAARQDESEHILQRLGGDDFVIVLDERGKQYDSPGFTQLVTSPLERSQNVAIIIGGAYGVTDELREKASVVWSLSDLVFPHQLVRLLLIEQLYRAQTIHLRLPYHNE